MEVGGNRRNCLRPETESEEKKAIKTSTLERKIIMMQKREQNIFGWWKHGLPVSICSCHHKEIKSRVNVSEN
mgnify:CR=1 FL=1